MREKKRKRKENLMRYLKWWETRDENLVDKREWEDGVSYISSPASNPKNHIRKIDKMWKW